MRRRVALGTLAVIGAGLGWALAGSPSLGHSADRYHLDVVARTASLRQTANAVAAVTFDFRGIDTLGEEFILFAAVLGVAVVLRTLRREQEELPVEDRFRPTATTELVRAMALLLMGPSVLVGLYVVAHGHLSPGGGFQGGVIVGSALVLAYAAAEYAEVEATHPGRRLEVAEALGAGGFAVIALLGLLIGHSLLENFLPYGANGELLSAGTLPLLNVVVGLAVGAGTVGILRGFFQQALALRERDPPTDPEEPSP